MSAYARRADALLIIADNEISGVVGMALGTPATSCPGGLCILQMVFVAPGHWGEGIGGRLVDAAVAEARSQGFRRAQLWTHAANSRARQLYEGHGFVDSGRQEIGELGEPIVQYERATRLLSWSPALVCTGICSTACGARLALPPSSIRTHGTSTPRYWR